MRSSRPITLLIAALGGEGGGVLTDWIVSAAAHAGYPVQSTSIPGVAQRTGATTYYIEILPVQAAELDGKRPVLALTPGVGDIDVAVASELLEAGRTVANGFVTPDRTHVIASLSRFYAMDEKIAMGDGRFDQDRLIKVIRDFAKDALLIDMDALAKQSGSIINAVMLGAIAGCGRLPIKPEQFEAAIREDGKAVESNLRGFRAGFEAARANLPPVKATDKKRRATTTPAMVEHEVARTFPAVAQTTGLEGVRRLIHYQSVPYAWLYLSRLRPIVEADQSQRRAGETAQGSRAAPCRAHVVRGCRARRAGEDRAGAHAAHRARRAARHHRALFRARFPQARHRGNVPAAATVFGETDPAARRAQRLARPRPFRHGGQLHIGAGLSAFPDARQAAAPAPLWLSLQAGAATDRKLACVDPRGRAAVTRACARRSPNARG